MGCDSFCHVVRQVEDISIVWGGCFSIAIGSVCRRGINQAYSLFLSVTFTIWVAASIRAFSSVITCKSLILRGLLWSICARTQGAAFCWDTSCCCCCGGWSGSRFSCSLVVLSQVWPLLELVYTFKNIFQGLGFFCLLKCCQIAIDHPDITVVIG